MSLIHQPLAMIWKSTWITSASTLPRFPNLMVAACWPFTGFAGTAGVKDAVHTTKQKPWICPAVDRISAILRDRVQQFQIGMERFIHARTYLIGQSLNLPADVFRRLTLLVRRLHRRNSDLLCTDQFLQLHFDCRRKNSYPTNWTSRV